MASVRQHLFLILKIALAIGLTGAASRLLSFTDQAFSLFWPPAGIGLAVIWFWGWRGVAGVLLGMAAWAAALYGGQPIPILAAMVAGCIGPCLVVLILRNSFVLGLISWLRQSGVERFGINLLVAFFAIELLIAAPAASLVGATALMAAGILPNTNPMDVYLGYWVVETLGAILFAPATIAFIMQYRRGRLSRNVLEWFDWPVLLACAAVATAQISLSLAHQVPYARALLFVYFPLLAACAVRNRVFKTNATLVVSVVLIITARSFDFSASAQTTYSQNAVFMLVEQSLMMFILVGMCQTLLAMAAERRNAMERLAQRERTCQYTQFMNNAGFRAAWVVQSPSARQLVGVSMYNFFSTTQLVGYEHTRVLLQEIGHRLQQIAPQIKWARIDAAVFVAVVDKQDMPPNIGQSLHQQLNHASWLIEGRRIVLNCSAACLSIDSNQMLQADEALLAMRLALDSAALAPGEHCIMAPIDMQPVNHRREFIEQLEQARRLIGQRQLLLYAQSVQASATAVEHQPDGLKDIEILLRVPGPYGEVLPAATLINVAMRGGLMQELDHAMIEAVFAWYAAHPGALKRTRKCAINLSGMSVSDITLPQYVAQRLNHYGLPARVFAFEVTESQALSDPQHAIQVLRQLRAQGFSVALDDFGTGFATFDYLKRIEVDYLKIDGSFIKDLGTDSLDDEIIKSIVNVSKRLNIKTVAEHVWNHKVLRHVTELGVDYVQGFAVDEPKPLAEHFSIKQESAHHQDTDLYVVKPA